MSGDHDTRLLSVIKAIAGEENLEENYLRLKKLTDAYAISQCNIVLESERTVAYDRGFRDGYEEGYNYQGER